MVGDQKQRPATVYPSEQSIDLRLRESGPVRKAFVTLGVFGRQRVGNHEDLASCERLGVQTLGERRDAGSRRRAGGVPNGA